MIDAIVADDDSDDGGKPVESTVETADVRQVVEQTVCWARELDPIIAALENNRACDRLIIILRVRRLLRLADHQLKWVNLFNQDRADVPKVVAEVEAFRLDDDWVFDFLIAKQLEARDAASPRDRFRLVEAWIESLVISQREDTFVLDVIVDSIFI